MGLGRKERYTCVSLAMLNFKTLILHLELFCENRLLRHGIIASEGRNIFEIVDAYLKLLASPGQCG